MKKKFQKVSYELFITKCWLSISGSGHFFSLQTLPPLYHVNVLMTAIRFTWFDCYAERVIGLSPLTACKDDLHKFLLIFYTFAWKYQKYEVVIVQHFPKLILPSQRQVWQSSTALGVMKKSDVPWQGDFFSFFLMNVHFISFHSQSKVPRTILSSGTGWFAFSLAQAGSSHNQLFILL